MDVRVVEAPDASELLRSQDLPTDDIADNSIELLGAYHEQQLVGVIGLQRCGAHGLMRSLAVEPMQRRRGIAETLCGRVFERAKELQLQDVWLLTTSARLYFERHGFEVVERSNVPEDIRSTSQFSSLCPASAVVMRRTFAS